MRKAKVTIGMIVDELFNAMPKEEYIEPLIRKKSSYVYLVLACDEKEKYLEIHLKRREIFYSLDYDEKDKEVIPIQLTELHKLIKWFFEDDAEYDSLTGEQNERKHRQQK